VPQLRRAYSSIGHARRAESRSLEPTHSQPPPVRHDGSRATTSPRATPLGQPACLAPTAWDAIYWAPSNRPGPCGEDQGLARSAVQVRRTCIATIIPRAATTCPRRKDREHFAAVPVLAHGFANACSSWKDRPFDADAQPGPPLPLPPGRAGGWSCRRAIAVCKTFLRSWLECWANNRLAHGQNRQTRCLRLGRAVPLWRSAPEF